LEYTESFSPDSQEFQIDDSFWSETLAMTVDSSSSVMDAGDPLLAADGASMLSSNADFWVELFMQADDMQNLPQVYT
jgi:myb proto-oncogene protein